jgi:CRISPR-associated DxTHG motif protein
MQLLTFLGVFNLETTDFTWQNQVLLSSPYVVEALLKFKKIDKITVFLTPEAEKHSNWQELQNRINNLENITIVSKQITFGQSEKDFWQLFNAVVNSVETGSEIIFDITHAFRSIPFLAFLATAFLQKAKAVTVNNIFYGAFERGQSQTPIVDLTPALDLLDWLNATNRFVETGDGQVLANLLSKNDPTANDLALSVTGIAQGLQLLRPMDIMRESALLPERIKAAVTISQTVPPFATLLDRVKQDYGKFALDNPEDYTNNAKLALLRQIDMIDWYAAKGQIVQALSMAREWLPSLLCYHFELDPQLEKPNRAEMELLLSGGATPPDANGNKYKSPYLEKYKVTVSKEKRGKLLDIWSQKYKLANLRNDVLHSGFRKNPQSATDILKKTEEVIRELKGIAKQWNLYD